MNRRLSSTQKYKILLKNPQKWIENFIKIVNKEGKLVSFKFNELQEYFTNNFEKFNSILKSRQLGFSSVACALSLYYACTQPNTECLLVSYSIDSATAIFEKLKSMYYSIPKVIRPQYIRNSKKELKFNNGSRIVVATAGNKELARGMTLKFVHLSEFGFWKDNANKQLLAIEQALRPDGQLIIESTANGLNWFNTLYFKAKNKENMYKSFFFNWVEGGCMFQSEYKETLKRWMATYGSLLTYDELDDYEKALFDDYHATIAQIIWRRYKISNSSEDQFRQEFPLTDIESFISTGAAVFDNARIDSIEKSIHTKVKSKKEYIRKEKLVKALPVNLLRFYGKSLFIYSDVKENERYYLGIDTAEGLGGDRDYSVIEVLNKNGQEVALFRSNKIKPYEFAKIVYDMGHYFNKGLLTVEKASAGHTVIEKLYYEMHYKNMTRYTTYDERNKAVINIGFDTNSKTKPIIINDLREWFDTGLLQVNSIAVLEEMKMFEASDNGSFGARVGSHDDTIIGLALCIAGIKSGIWYKY